MSAAVEAAADGSANAEAALLKRTRPCVFITPFMTQMLAQELKQTYCTAAVEVVVAANEADAELAHRRRTNNVAALISADSDYLLLDRLSRVVSRVNVRKGIAKVMDATSVCAAVNLTPDEVRNSSCSCVVQVDTRSLFHPGDVCVPVVPRLPLLRRSSAQTTRTSASSALDLQQSSLD
jgi:hypothetical protein